MYECEKCGVTNINFIIEKDVIFFLLYMKYVDGEIYEIIANHLTEDNFTTKECKSIFNILSQAICDGDWPFTALRLYMVAEHEEDRQFIEEYLDKKPSFDISTERFKFCVQLLFDTNYQNQREALRKKIQSGNISDKECMELAMQFSLLSRKTI